MSRARFRPPWLVAAAGLLLIVVMAAVAAVAYLGVAALWIVGALVLTPGAIIGHRIRVDTAGNLLIIDHPTGAWRWWSWLNAMFFPLGLAALADRPGAQLPARLG